MNVWSPCNLEQISQYVGYRLNKAGRGDIRLTKGGLQGSANEAVREYHV